ncbi:MAG: C69 family dipeptidase [Bacteroidales bacterium]|nr:C69 family dipeptidase [Bacteroidales bacterium]
MKKRLILFLAFILTVWAGRDAMACTNFLVTKGASKDGSVMISYSADSHTLYGELYHWPAASWPAGSMLDVYEWDTGKFLGKIPQAHITYNVVGNMNEHQVAIGETTYTGLEELGTQSGAIMDYGSLMYIALQRSKTAREAMKVITELMNDYGYASTGESLSISDANEAWIFEMIGKGEGQKGGVWVAMKIPDGYISAHANQARITTFPVADGKKSIKFSQRSLLMNPEVECFYADDVVSFASSKGWFKGNDVDFSFSDIYAPVTFTSARFCEIRVWSFFKSANKEMEKYLDYASGNLKHDKIFEDGRANKNGYPSNRMPLWIKPDHLLELHEMMNYMRDHLEGTPLDMTTDLGAGPFGCPYRWRPLTWTVDDITYCNERATSSQQTGFWFVAQSRSWLPDPVGGIFWFGVDDATSSLLMPMYSCIKRVPEKMARGYGSMMEFVDDAAFWVFNQISNLSYTRYSYIHPEIFIKQQANEMKFIAAVPEIDNAAKSLLGTNPDKAIDFLTDFSVTTGNNAVMDWKKFYGHLFTRFMDGNIKTAVEVPEGYIYQAPKVEQPGYPEWFLRMIIDQTGDKLKVVGDGH